jgi:hypothetical protein
LYPSRNNSGKMNLVLEWTYVASVLLMILHT